MSFLAALGLTSCMFAPAPIPANHVQEVAVDRREDPADTLADLQQEFAEAQNAFMKLYQEAKTDEERQKLFEEKYPKPDRFAKEALEIANDAKGTPVAAEALVWALQLGLDPRMQANCLKLLLENHIESEDLGDVCFQLYGSPESEKFMTELLEKSPHESVKGKALFQLASTKKDSAQNPDDEKAALELFNRVIEEFAGIDHPWGGSLGDQARQNVFDIENLGIGKTCPEIEGEDADGVAFKLSDYKGKVIFLDFWGFW
jgi:hypothetical protein